MSFTADDCAEVRNILGGKGLGFRYADVTRFFKKADCQPPKKPKGTHRVWVHPTGARLQTKDDGNRQLLPPYVKKPLATLAQAEGCP